MRQILLIMLTALLILGCQKDFQSSNNNYIETVRKGLKDSLSIPDFQSLNFTMSARTNVDSVGLFFLRIPFKGLKPNEDFVLVKTNEKGVIEKGKIVHLQGKFETVNGDSKLKSWNGTVSLFSLNRKDILKSPIRNGFITAFHQLSRYRTATQEPQGKTMPEVIITYTIPSGGGTSWSNWFMIQSFLADGGSSYGGQGYYSDFSGGGGGSGGGYTNDGGNYNGGGITGDGYRDPVIHVDSELQDLRQGINIQGYIKCFSNIPDAGAICSIEISADVPVDDNPNAFFNLSTGSPGHVFITVTKKNGNQNVSQNIGFYPKSGYKAMTYAPTAGKLVDNAKHEFNASIFMSLTPDQLSAVLVRMQQLSNINYDVDSYNCTDWALDIFNSTRTDKLKIPLYGIPNSQMTQGSQTPQGLYQQLQQMKSSNHPEKGNITIGIVKGYAGGSTGPCN